MNILIDIGHPAHVHLFKFFALEMQINGNHILFTCRDKEFEIQLLEANNLKYRSFGRKYSSATGKIFGMLKFDFLEMQTALKFKPDIFLSHGSIYAAHASALLRKPHISFEDTFNFEQIRLYKPFTDVILTADYDHPLKSEKIVKFSGYHELAYLHPSRFTPDETILKKLGVGRDEKYVILRFVSWKASHDFGHKGISLKNKFKAVEQFSKYARVFISSESELPEEMKKYKIPLAPERMHDALAFATLLWAESFTMPAECSVLGTPSVIMHNTTSLYLKEQQDKYGLCFNYSESEYDQERAIEKSIEILQTDNLKEQWEKKKNKMLAEKIDVTAFLLWFVENYPQSLITLRKNPDYQLNFK